MNKGYKYVIFDLDGTLMDTLKDISISTNVALAHFGLVERTIAEICSFVGDGVRQLIERAVPATFPKEQVDDVLAIFREHYALHCRDHSAPYEGILPTLRSLHEGGVAMAIVSNKPDREVKRLNEEFFSDFIAVALGENEQAGIPKKPSPEMLAAAMRQLGCLPSQALYVGDSDVDIQTARNAGVDCVSVTWGFRSEEFLLRHGASRTIGQPSDLLKVALG